MLTVTVQFDRSNNSCQCVYVLYAAECFFMCSKKRETPFFVTVFLSHVHTNKRFFPCKQKCDGFPIIYVLFLFYKFFSQAQARVSSLSILIHVVQQKKNRLLSVIVVIFGIRLRLNHVRCVLFAFRWEFPYANTKLQLEMMKNAKTFVFLWRCVCGADYLLCFSSEA